LNNDSTYAGPFAFAHQTDNTLSPNLPDNQLRNIDACGPQSSDAHSGGTDSSEGAIDVDTTHIAPLDIPGLLNDPSPSATTVSDIPSSDIENL
jgi:hypothetical protein